MDLRALLAVAFGLMLVAGGGFYFAFAPRSHEIVPPPAPAAAAPPRAKATPASVEAELARTDQAELVELLKQRFPEDYEGLIAAAARLRGERASDAAFNQEVASRLQQIMRSKLKFAAAADMPVIDRLAENEMNLFHALGTDASAFCLKVLGKDNGPDPGPLPQEVRRMMQLGNLFRFQAVVDGMPRFRPVEPLNANEAAMLDAALSRDGMRLEDVRSGAFLNTDSGSQGKPCLMVEKLYRAISGLGEETRRKLYAGMFFLDRDR